MVVFNLEDDIIKFSKVFFAWALATYLAVLPCQ
jgi:hypothetical protein